MSEVIFLALLALIVIGPKQLPEVARTVGRFLNELKRTTSDLTDEIKQQTGLSELNLRDPLARFDELKKKSAEGTENQNQNPDSPEQMELSELVPTDSEENKQS